MSTQKFKTNIKCGGCISAVTPALDKTPGIYKWEVDTNSPDKVLTIEGDASSDTVIKAVEAAGYTATELKD
ncbi:heavy-metal-associated domain-containing protein [Rufibacter soli]|jgi:copper chaperone